MARETTHENINKQSTFRIFHFMKQIVNENQTLRFKNNRKVLFQFPIGRLPFFFVFLNNICTISYIYFRQRLLFVSEKSLCLRRDFSIKTCSVYFYLHFLLQKVSNHKRLLISSLSEETKIPEFNCDSSWTGPKPASLGVVASNSPQSSSNLTLTVHSWNKSLKVPRNSKIIIKTNTNAH